MARSRNIKPGFFINDELSEVPPLGRLLFAGLWTIADKEGRMQDRVKKIKAQILPYDDCDVDALLIDLHNKGFIYRFTDGESKYIQVLNWKKHQNPHVKETDSIIPAPTEHHTSTVQEQTEPSSNPSDSLNLIPDSGFPVTDSLNPITPLSGKPDHAPQVAEAINHLNKQTGSKFQCVDANAKFIKARLNEGRTVSDIIAVIDQQVRAWANDKKMQKYLRPKTLFSAENFNQYFGQLGTTSAMTGPEQWLAQTSTIEGELDNE